MAKSNFVLSVLVAVLGLVVILIPEQCIKIAVIIMGAATIIEGFHTVFKVRLLLPDSNFRRLMLIKGLASLVVGLLAVCLPAAFFNTVEGVIRVMLYVLAVYLVILAFSELVVSAQLKQNNIPSRVHLVQACYSAVIAVVLFLLPAHFGVLIMRILGLVLILAGIAYALYLWHNRSIELTPDEVKDADAE